MKLKPVLFVALFCGMAFKGYSQYAMPDQAANLNVLLENLRSASNDTIREKANLAFRDLLEKTLNEPAAYTYPFQELESVGKIDSPDGKIRIICWNVEQDDHSQRYYTFILKQDEKKGGHKVYELIDNPDPYLGRTDEVLDGENWYGALYYQIIPAERNNKTVYIVLGWDGASDRTNMKIIDVLSFSGTHVKLGAAMFKLRDLTQKRVYFEHSEKAVMSLRWDDSQGRIIFDHLSPESSNLEGFYEYYVPDMSYDALELQGTKWVLVEDIIALNKNKQTVSISHIDEKTGEVTGDVKTEEVETVWTDPSNGENKHVAAMPDKTNPDAVEPKKEERRTAQEIWDGQRRHRRESKQTGSATNIGKKPKRGK